jgi:hypothetical protein
MKRLGALVGVLALVASCGSSNNGGNNGPVGSVVGNSLTINDAIYALDTRLNFLFLLASDRTGLCALYTDSNPPTGKSTVLIGGLIDFDGQNLIPPAAGTYNWVSAQNPPTTAAGKYLFSQFLVANGCTTTTQVDATGGTVTLGAVGANTAGSHTTGSFNLKFGADSLAGNVDATYCAALLANNQAPVACP